MQQGQFVAGWFTPLQGSAPGLPELPGRPPIGKPIKPLPPLPPGVEEPTHPIEIPEGEGPPVEVPGTPEHPITYPPGFVWPPFDPSDAIYGKALLLVWVPGVQKFKWVVIEVPDYVPPAGGIGGTPPPRPTPGGR